MLDDAEDHVSATLDLELVRWHLLRSRRGHSPSYCADSDVETLRRPTPNHGRDLAGDLIDGVVGRTQRDLVG